MRCCHVKFCEFAKPLITPYSFLHQSCKTCPFVDFRMWKIMEAISFWYAEKNCNPKELKFWNFTLTWSQLFPLWNRKNATFVPLRILGHKCPIWFWQSSPFYLKLVSISNTWNQFLSGEVLESTNLQFITKPAQLQTEKMPLLWSIMPNFLSWMTLRMMVLTCGVSKNCGKKMKLAREHAYDYI